MVEILADFIATNPAGGAEIAAKSYGGVAAMHGYLAGGSQTSPSPAPNGSMPLGIGCRPWLGTRYSEHSTAAWHYLMREDASETGQGTLIRGVVTPIGGTWADRVNAFELRCDAVGQLPYAWFPGEVRVNADTPLTSYTTKAWVTLRHTPGSRHALKLEVDNAGTAAALAVFVNQTGVVGSISASGTGTVYAVTSDYRLKPQSEVLTGFWDRLSRVVSRLNTWVNGDRKAGFIAHEFAEVYPSAVVGEKDAVNDDGTPSYQTMDPAAPEVMADIIAALNDINARLREIEQRPATS